MVTTPRFLPISYSLSPRLIGPPCGFGFVRLTAENRTHLRGQFVHAGSTGAGTAPSAGAVLDDWYIVQDDPAAFSPPPRPPSSGAPRIISSRVQGFGRCIRVHVQLKAREIRCTVHACSVSSRKMRRRRCQHALADRPKTSTRRHPNWTAPRTDRRC
eukprot:621088-Pyramimonas_sp.AAC.1